MLLDIKGIIIYCMFFVYGYDDVFYGYGYIIFYNVCVLVINFVFGEGCGFEII